MRAFLAVLVALVPLSISAPAQTVPCTGLCQQQVVCPNNGTTSISGYVYAPNGTDPLPDVTVYVPNAPVDAFTPGVSCPVVGAAPSGSPLVGTTTDFDGSFTLTNVPVGTGIPLVIVSGRWRRQVTVDVTNSCGDNAFSTRFPQNQTEGDIPKIAVATGSADSVECVLRKVGLADSEFTDASGTGRINFYGGSYSAGAKTSTATPTPTEAALMGTAANLNQYDVLMLPCEGGPQVRPAQQLANLVSFANSGGRIYASHYAYSWFYSNPPFNTVANWLGNSGATQLTGTATVNTSFSQGATLSQWLQLVGATTTPGQMEVDVIRHDINGTVSPTRNWLTLNNKLDTDSAPVMQFVWDAPVGNTTNQCGRVLFNEYHVENPVLASAGVVFPKECPSGTTMTPQEKLLEYSLFELTSDGGQPTLDPTSGNFGNLTVGFTSSQLTFNWTNNSSFVSSVNSATTNSSIFNVVSNNCGQVASGASCQIGVTFTPTALGAVTGKLTVASTAKTITASLTGTGVPGFSMSPASIDFGKVDVGFSSTQTVVLSNIAPGALPLPTFTLTGDYSATTNCAATVPAQSNCNIYVTFTPTATGPRTGSLTVPSAGTTLVTALTGTGVDFTLTINPTSGTVIAGLGTSFTATLTPLAGFSNNVTISCLFTVPGATCGSNPAAITLTAQSSSKLNITTTSQYTVVGYGGFARGTLALLASALGLLLLAARRRNGKALRAVALMLAFAALTFPTTGCSGKLPAQNALYSAPGTYTFTVSATDGLIVRTATYQLTITAK
jgi:hypothetical protein